MLSKVYPLSALHPDDPAINPSIVVQHMSTYWAILEKVRGSTIKLTKLDDEIYEHLKVDFPDFDPAATINEDEMKSKTGKERWRKFMMAYEKKISDYNFGTMLRGDPKWEYGQDETIFGTLEGLRVLRENCANRFPVPRMQFYAIEIARNRAGLNDWVFEGQQKNKAGGEVEESKS